MRSEVRLSKLEVTLGVVSMSTANSSKEITMASTLNRRVVALEEKQVLAKGRSAKILFIPCGLSETEEAEWYAEHVPQAEASSPMVMVVRFMRPGEMRDAR